MPLEKAKSACNKLVGTIKTTNDSIAPISGSTEKKRELQAVYKGIKESLHALEHVLGWLELPNGEIMTLQALKDMLKTSQDACHMAEICLSQVKGWLQGVSKH